MYPKGTPIWQKVALNYSATFGGLIIFLTVNGFWKQVEAFLNDNSPYGLFISFIHVTGWFAYYHFEEKFPRP